MAERLVFMAVEGAARHLQGLSPDRRVDRDELDERAGGLLMPAAAGWIVPPSVSLTRTGFRVWSPMTGLATSNGESICPSGRYPPIVSVAADPIVNASSPGAGPFVNWAAAASGWVPAA